MAKTQFIFPDNIPFRILADHLATDDDFLKDAQLLLGLSDESFSALESAFKNAESFVDRRFIESAAERLLKLTPEKSYDFTHLLTRLNRLVRDADEPLDRAIEILSSAITKNAKALKAHDRSKLVDRITRVLTKSRGLWLQYKAEELVEATGSTLEKLQVICDLRPVFNEDRSRIVGAFPISTIKIEYRDTDGTTKAVELHAKESQLADLVSSFDGAIKKIASAKHFLLDRQIAMPETGATLQEKGAS